MRRGEEDETGDPNNRHGVAPARRRRVVLAVDDEPDMRENVARIMRRGGYDCRTMGSGQEAVASAARQRPDLVLMDLRMPGLDGLALLGELERIAPGIPVVIVTAYASDETAQDAVRAGAAAGLAKPFTAAQLLKGGSMATPHPMCSTCSRPIVLGAFSISKHGEMAHLNCQESLRSVNNWPEGIRHLLCLNCGRAFQSDSKAQRLCSACRSGSRSKTL